MSRHTEIDLSHPREPIYRSFDGGPGPCPKCGGLLKQNRQTYCVATRLGRKLRDSFMIGSDFGWFCEQCPVVVLNSRAIREMLSHSMPHWDVGNEFLVEGIVDLDAVPKDKRNVPLGGDDNPIPLVAFQHSDETANHSPALTKAERGRRKKLLASARKRRN
jgi:hypothetical protein